MTVELMRLRSPPQPCSYLPEQTASLDYRIVLHGVRGPIDVGGGVTYNREMPGVGPILANERVAGRLEVGPRICLARIGRHNRILVEVVELFAGLRVFALGAAILLLGQLVPL